MDLAAELFKEHSKRNAVRLARWIGNDPRRFGELMTLLLTGDERTAVRAAWILSHCADQHPSIILPWMSKLVKRASEKNAPGAVQRNVVRVLQYVEIPKAQQGRVAQLCFDFLQDPKIPVAVKVFSMTVLANIARTEPDLKNELRLIVQQMVPYGSGAIQSRARMVLKQLSK